MKTIIDQTSAVIVSYCDSKTAERYLEDENLIALEGRVLAGSDWNGVTLRLPEPPEEDLSITIARGCREIDRRAGEVRQKVITTYPGQAETYRAKEIEARAYLADIAPVDENYPMLAAEVGLAGDTSLSVAEAVIQKAAEWRATAAQIERVRLSAKQQLAMVETVDEIEPIITALVWPVVS